MTTPDTSGMHYRKTNSKSSSKYDKLVTESRLPAPSTESHLKTSSTNYSLYALVSVFVISLITRFYKIYAPSEVVFDEVHFGKFASYYLRREYYFDVHPPLAKMMLAFPGWLVGYKGNFLFDKIGMSYLTNGSPYFIMRCSVAFFSSFIPPLIYMIMSESGYALLTSFFTALMVSFDNAIVLHGRLILLDTFLLFFIFASIYSYIRFFKLRYEPFTTSWYIWLASTGTFLGLTISCKLVGLFTYATIGCLVIFDLWRLIDVRRYPSLSQFPKHFASRVAFLIALPFFVYLASFYVHFAILNKSGKGDAYHSRVFQMQLKNNPLTINSDPIYYGDSVVFKHTDTNNYLYSRNATYPRVYEDKRVSSSGQQVVGFPSVNESAYWTVLPEQNFDEFLQYFEPTGEKKSDEKIPADIIEKFKVRHDSPVRLFHKQTRRVLRTHDVASPLTTTNMEVTTANIDDDKTFEDTIFYLRLVEPLNAVNSDGSPVVEYISKLPKKLRIISRPHNVAVLTQRAKLPAWGYRNQEVNGVKDPNSRNAMWGITQVSSYNHTSGSNKFVIPKMSFFSKFKELQNLMIDHNSRLTKPHPYQSHPIIWPFITRGVSFWTKKETKSQIYYLSNPFGTYLSLLGIICLSAILLSVCIADRRNMVIVSDIQRRHLFRSGAMLLIGFALHYLPFFIMGRSLFIHHYIPASTFAYMILGAVIQYIGFNDYQLFALSSPTYTRPNLPILPKSRNFLISIAIFFTLQVLAFIYLSPFIYGTPLTPDQIASRKLLSSWDFSFASKR
ncbi:hypothetical protein BB560_005267 [Smittium megazygosporum]|uniref:Dolichyl-phosphate-mannose--protein mannosyltransferase n=1 Tax=Smittium megazygosporum TaxID=133381 RepID=A0A2T9Z735_9FUNG|nr:hypothetical protein BB560_005267 [Smittium megazygosporum]